MSSNPVKVVYHYRRLNCNFPHHQGLYCFFFSIPTQNSYKVQILHFMVYFDTSHRILITHKSICKIRLLYPPCCYEYVCLFLQCNCKIVIENKTYVNSITFKFYDIEQDELPGASVTLHPRNHEMTS